MLVSGVQHSDCIFLQIILKKLRREIPKCLLAVKFLIQQVPRIRTANKLPGAATVAAPVIIFFSVILNNNIIEKHCVRRTEIIQLSQGLPAD